MNSIVLQEVPGEELYPFALTGSVLDIRVGIFTLREKWEVFTGSRVRVSDEPGSPLANILPRPSIRTRERDGSPVKKLEYPWQLFQCTDMGIRDDFEPAIANKTGAPLSATNQAIAPEHIFIEEGARVEHALLNASTGPIYISKHAEIMEGSMVRGPFFLGEASILKMGTKIYGATSIGNKCVAGGEIKNSVIFDGSNKAHDGYLGDSVIGSWCNLGAGTSNSNLKNTAGEVRVFHRPSGQFLSAGTKCGLLMGDHSRCAINTSFNTGTVVGISCNVFATGLTPKHIPNFSWGTGNENSYTFEKAMEDISRWKGLKQETLSAQEIRKLRAIFDKH